MTKSTKNGIKLPSISQTSITAIITPILNPILYWCFSL